MRERLFAPLGLTHTVTLPEEALLHRAAVGHIDEPDAEPARAPPWGLPRSLGPAGLVTSTAADVLALRPDAPRRRPRCRRHADAQRGARRGHDRARGRPAGQVHRSATRGASAGSASAGTARRLIGHDGNTLGQAAFLRVLPEEGLAVTLLTNGGNTRDLYEDLYREIFAELAGVEMPRPLTPPAEPVRST